MPNPNKLPWKHYQDINLVDKPIRDQFYNLFEQGRYAEALVYLQNNAKQIDGKAFMADTMNVLLSGVTWLEDEYKTNVTDYLIMLTNQYNTLINNFRSRSDWIPTLTYSQYNFAIYQGDLYMAMSNVPTGTLPTDSTYWLLLGLKGFPGQTSVSNVQVKYAWNDTTEYLINDVVSHKNELFYAVTPNTNMEPGLNPDIWKTFIAMVPGQIFIGPEDVNIPHFNNTVWIQTDVDPLTATDTVYGQTKVYVNNTAVTPHWENMYPTTVITNVVDVDKIFKETVVSLATLVTTGWTLDTATGKYKYVLNVPAINFNNYTLVRVMPQLQRAPYQKYFDKIDGITPVDSVINLTAFELPTENIDIVVLAN